MRTFDLYKDIASRAFLGDIEKDLSPIRSTNSLEISSEYFFTYFYIIAIIKIIITQNQFILRSKYLKFLKIDIFFALFLE